MILYHSKLKHVLRLFINRMICRTAIDSVSFHNKELVLLWLQSCSELWYWNTTSLLESFAQYWTVSLLGVLQGDVSCFPKLLLYTLPYSIHECMFETTSIFYLAFHLRCVGDWHGENNVLLGGFEQSVVWTQSYLKDGDYNKTMQPPVMEKQEILQGKLHGRGEEELS